MEVRMDVTGVLRWLHAVPSENREEVARAVAMEIAGLRDMYRVHSQLPTVHGTDCVALVVLSKPTSRIDLAPAPWHTVALLPPHFPQFPESERIKVPERITQIGFEFNARPIAQRYSKDPSAYLRVARIK